MLVGVFRILGDPQSSIVDLPLTALQSELLSVAAWYNNEMAYSTRQAQKGGNMTLAVVSSIWSHNVPNPVSLGARVRNP